MTHSHSNRAHQNNPKPAHTTSPKPVVTSWTTRAPLSGTGLGLKLEIVAPLTNHFFITSDPKMPDITVQAFLGDWVTAVPGQPAILQPWADADNAKVQFTWDANIAFTGSTECPHSVRHNGGPVTTVPIRVNASTMGGQFTLKFNEIRGGNLEIQVTARIRNQTLTLKSTGLRVGGTNPSLQMLSGAIPNDVLKRIAQHESGARQFLGMPGCTGVWPLFSKDNLGGVGLFQVTNPAPTADEIWDWRANLTAGIRVYKEKRSVAERYANKCRTSTRFQELIQNYNRQRAAQNKKPITITLLDFTDEQLDDDTIRGFNGYGGTDSLGQSSSLHEFEVPVEGNQIVVSDIDETKLTGVVKWQRTPVAKRFHMVKGKDGKEHSQAIGDPSYVENIKKQPLF